MRVVRFSLLWLCLLSLKANADEAWSRAVRNHLEQLRAKQTVLHTELQAVEFRLTQYQALQQAGYAAPVESQPALQRARALQVEISQIHDQQQTALAASRAIRNGDATVFTEADQPPRSVLIRVPGLSAFSELSTIQTLSIPTRKKRAPVLVLPCEHRHEALAAEEEYLNEYEQRVQQLVPSPAQQSELTLVQLRLSEVIAQRNQLQDVQVVVPQSELTPLACGDDVVYNVEELLSVIDTGTNTQHASVQPDLMANIDSVSAHLQQRHNNQLAALLELQAVSRQSESRVSELSRLTADDQSFAVELRREKLLHTIATARVEAIQEEEASTKTLLAYLHAVKKHLLTGTKATRREARRACLNVFTAHAQQVGQANVVTAQLNYLNWRWEALQELQSEGLSTWKEVAQTKLQMKQSQALLEDARDHQKVAKRAAKFIRQNSKLLDWTPSTQVAHK